MSVIRIGTTSCLCTSTSSKKRTKNQFLITVSIMHQKGTMIQTNDMLTQHHEKEGL